MNQSDIAKLQEDILEQASLGISSFGLVGSGTAGVELVRWFRELLPSCVVRWYSDETLASLTGSSAPRKDLSREAPPVIVVVDDADKMATVRAIAIDLSYVPKLIVAGYAHHDFRDSGFEAILADLLVPSIANGYPNTLVHLYQCLKNAARLGLEGSVVEFGVFKGGTTMFLAKAVKALGRTWPVVGFDTFGGFPPKRSALDMYDHPGAEFHDFSAVRHYLEPAGIELVQGDIVETATQLAGRPVVAALIDTDNFAAAHAAVTALQDNIVIGGAIVFDHFTGTDHFRYTLGEKIAAGALQADDRYFNLHATGVFLRQK
jgi:O-methyltransferase